MSLFPLIRFDPITSGQTNDALERWSHRMGPLNRPFQSIDRYHGLFHTEQLVAVVTTSSLICARVGGGGLATLTGRIAWSFLGFARTAQACAALRFGCGASLYSPALGCQS